MCEMKNFLMRLLFTVLAVVLVNQDVFVLAEEQEQQVEKPAVTTEDLKRATAEMKRVAREEARKAEEKSAEQAKLNRELAKKQHEETLEAARVAEEKLRADITRQSELERRKAEAEQEKTRRIMIYGVAGVAMLVIVAIGSVFVVARRKHKTVEGEVPTHFTDMSVRPEVLTDPNLGDLRDYAKRNGDMKKVPFILTLPKEGLRFNCEAELRENNDPLVYIDGSKTAVTWKQRRNKASEISQTTT